MQDRVWRAVGTVTPERSRGECKRTTAQQGQQRPSPTPLDQAHPTKLMCSSFPKFRMSSVCLMHYLADWVLISVDFSGLSSSKQPHAAWQRENELKNHVYTLLVDNTIPFVSLQTAVCKYAELRWSVWYPDNQGTIALVMSASLSPTTHNSNMHRYMYTLDNHTP